jgi:peroxin-2
MAYPANALMSLTVLAPSNEPSAPSSSDGPQQNTLNAENDPPAYPLYTPYRASCGDVYCYHCVAERMMRAAEEEEVWECLRCGEGVRSVDRFVVDNGNVSDVSGSEFEFSDIVTDLSGSVGSLSTSE